MKGFLTISLLLVLSQVNFGQSALKKQTIETVFKELTTAYGSSKYAPRIELISKGQKGVVPAWYSSYPSPTIYIDEKAFDICVGLGSDSLNALAIILSHEMAHYYNDHNWCSDYAFASKNPNLVKQLKSVSKIEKIKNETQADNYGIYYACIAGYKPMGVYDALIDRMYQVFKIKDEIPGYPSKQERKSIRSDAQKKMKELYELFIKGLDQLKQRKYADAIASFEELNKFFPSRENYNNLGVAQLLWALELKPRQAIEFMYPVYPDKETRLNFMGTRGDDDEDSKFQELLNKAKRSFEKSLQLDPLYVKGYINLASVYDLQDNPEGAIGKIKELPSQENFKPEILTILGIAWYHAGNKQKAIECLEKATQLGYIPASQNLKSVLDY